MAEYNKEPFYSLEEIFVKCTCGSPEHQVMFSFDPDEEEECYKEVYITVYLSQWRNIFKRIWVAVRYVFGYKSKYGDWDCINLNKYKANELARFLDKYLES